MVAKMNQMQDDQMIELETEISLQSFLVLFSIHPECLSNQFHYDANKETTQWSIQRQAERTLSSQVQAWLQATFRLALLQRGEYVLHHDE